MMNVVISAIRLEAEDIISIELVPANGGAMPVFDAGSHIDVHLPQGIIRQYSIWNHPDETHRYCVGVLKDPSSRGGSRAVHEQLRVGQVIQISEPRNLFPLDVKAKRSVLFAGGIGITPILSMAQRLAANNQDFEMHYCARAEEKAAFVRKLKGLPFADRVHFHFDSGAAEQKLNAPAFFTQEPKDSHIYVCGPTGFMDFVLNTAREHGWPEAHLHKEYFAAAPTSRSDDGTFEVQIHSTGQIFQIPSDQSVIQVLDAAGICIPVSCEQGICGTCVTRVLDGEPDHRDYFLSPEERAKNDQFTPCCSRAKSACLVLDL
ncbi:Vanillate O-demethylase reductase subunit [Pseudomonas sp. SG-MS2]|uniref:PDR/VanB family oxidoreductase n=1 Tax=Pseudomonas TaxID=286 RepID=UPI000CFD187C|nr:MULTISPECIES: PDR/VanB family oxidoreductase [unclassified Pseudomonas]KAF1311043.1 Vanillate O-demethylase reductase subunit [Pseudomonas sp. SG-MS2]PRA59408.1 oxidoreductase [Pseudomonas sp. MYb187]